jgi:hypothetical protein
MSPYPFYAPANCSVVPPTNGDWGTCKPIMLSGTTCSFSCNRGFVLNRLATQCALGTVYSLQGCVMDLAADDPDTPWTIIAVAVAMEAPSDQPVPASEPVQITTTYRWAKGTGSGSVTPADLTYDWRCSSHPHLSLLDPSLVLSPFNSSMLILNGEMLPSPATLVFEVAMTDINPFHLSSQLGRPWANSSVVVTTKAPVRLTVPMHLDSNGEIVDPCLEVGLSPCENGGVCSSAPDEKDPLMMRMSCACPSTPFAFFGPTCAVGLLACPDCSSAFAGGSTISLFGLGLSSLVGIHLAETRVAYTAVKWVDRTDSYVVDNTLNLWGHPGLNALQVVMFKSPPITGNATANLQAQQRQLQSFTDAEDDDAELDGDLASFALQSFSHETLSFGSNPSGIVPAYVLLRLQTRPPLGSEILNMNFTKLVYYTASLCLEEGQWTDDGNGGCLSCPKGTTDKRNSSPMRGRLCCTATGFLTCFCLRVRGCCALL